MAEKRPRKRVCDGTPPERPVWWDITPRTGAPRRGFGQTAFVAAADALLGLSDVEDMHVSADQDMTKGAEESVASPTSAPADLAHDDPTEPGFVRWLAEQLDDVDPTIADAADLNADDSVQNGHSS